MRKEQIICDICLKEHREDMGNIELSVHESLINTTHTNRIIDLKFNDICKKCAADIYNLIRDKKYFNEKEK